MTKSYLNELLDAFDQEFESLIIPFPQENSAVAAPVVPENLAPALETVSAENYNAINKLTQIEALAAEISAERYTPNYNPEICLANLLDHILAFEMPNPQEDFFQLLNQERNVDLAQALSDFDFYQNNPYKKKAEKILSKIEARKAK